MVFRFRISSQQTSISFGRDSSFLLGGARFKYKVTKRYISNSIISVSMNGHRKPAPFGAPGVPSNNGLEPETGFGLFMDGVVRTGSMMIQSFLVGSMLGLVTVPTPKRPENMLRAAPGWWSRLLYLCSDDLYHHFPTACVNRATHELRGSGCNCGQTGGG
jgi:hypothetical protein